MTYQELLDDVTAYQDNKLDDMRFSARVAYRSAELSVLGFGMAMGSKAKFPKIYEVYAGLFTEPDKGPPQQQSGEIMKARLMQYAEFINNKKKGE